MKHLFYGGFMDKREKVKSIYKTVVEIFLHSDNVVNYWKSQKMIEEFPSLFPEINFDEVNNEIDSELRNEGLFHKDAQLNQRILGYRYGNSPEIHPTLPDYNEEITVVYKDGSTKGYDYFNGELTRPRC
jgi:hypothetical protein